jgi:hypothetical protein
VSSAVSIQALGLPDRRIFSAINRVAAQFPLIGPTRFPGMRTTCFPEFGTTRFPQLGTTGRCHDAGAVNWACLASLIETAKLHGLDPQTYLADILAKLVNGRPWWAIIREHIPWEGIHGNGTTCLAAAHTGNVSGRGKSRHLSRRRGCHRQVRAQSSSAGAWVNQVTHDHPRNTGPMLSSPRCGARTRSGRPCRSPAVHGRKRCRMHGAPIENKNALKHGLYTKAEIEKRNQLRSLVKQSQKLLRDIG